MKNIYFFFSGEKAGSDAIDGLGDATDVAADGSGDANGPGDATACNDLKSTKSCHGGKEKGRCESSSSFANKCKKTCKIC